MKDQQTPTQTPTGGIPVISAALHCLSMPGLVFLRRNFGYAYLSPKKIFLALVFACGLLTYAVWHDQGLRPRFMYSAIFGATASGLYLLHLLLAFVKQGRSRAEHDQDSGTSNVLIFIRPPGRQKLEGFIHGWVEPGLVVVIGYLLTPRLIGQFLIISGSALALKELVRWWLALRLHKKREDNLLDAKEMMGEFQPEVFAAPPTAGKTGRERHQRRFATEENPTTDEAIHARELRLMPPYSLNIAESNFRSLADSVDPESPHAHEEMKRLNSAIRYFRNRPVLDNS